VFRDYVFCIVSLLRRVLAAIFITSSVCNFEYCVHVNTCTDSISRMYIFGYTCLWSMFMETLVYGIQRPQPAQTNVLVNTTALSARVNYFTHFLLSWSAYVSTTSIPYRFRTDVSDVACYYFHPQ
jgi:hypothetical protein